MLVVTYFPERCIVVYGRISSIFFAFSLITLFIMSLEQYLSAAFPIFYRKSVTRNRLLTLLATLFTSDAILLALISLGGRAFSYELKVVIFFGILSPPFILVNNKLLNIVKRMRQNNMISSKESTIFKLKNISSCLMAVACLLLVLIPLGVYIIFSLGEKLSSVKVVISQTWAGTMNSTLNCLIFHWKNKILRTESVKVLKSFKCVNQKTNQNTMTSRGQSIFYQIMNTKVTLTFT